VCFYLSVDEASYFEKNGNQYVVLRVAVHCYRSGCLNCFGGLKSVSVFSFFRQLNIRKNNGTPLRHAEDRTAGAAGSSREHGLQVQRSRRLIFSDLWPSVGKHPTSSYEYVVTTVCILYICLNTIFFSPSTPDDYIFPSSAIYQYLLLKHL
jgi:hypothetical protein